MKKTVLISMLLVASVAFVACKPKVEVAEVEDGTIEEKTEVIAMYPGSDSEYKVDSGKSTLKWSAKYIVGNKHDGTVSVSGNLAVTEGAISDGEFVIDMTTITESKDSEKFLGHITSADFFDVENFPESKIVITGIESNDKEGDVQVNYTITADLTIKDTTEEITFPAVVVIEDGVLTATTNISIDRTTWDITFGSGKFFEDLGDKVIDDTIQYEISIVAHDIEGDAMMEEHDGDVMEDNDAMMEDDDEEEDEE